MSNDLAASPVWTCARQHTNEQGTRIGFVTNLASNATCYNCGAPRPPYLSRKTEPHTSTRTEGQSAFARALRRGLGFLSCTMIESAHYDVLAGALREAELRDDVLAWQAATFPHRTIRSVTAHLAKEGAELHAEPSDRLEHADVRFLAWAALDEADRLAETHGINTDAACREKLAINRARVWGKPDADGVVLHEKAPAAPVEEGREGEAETLTAELAEAARNLSADLVRHFKRFPLHDGTVRLGLPREHWHLIVVALAASRAPHEGPTSGLREIAKRYGYCRDTHVGFPHGFTCLDKMEHARDLSNNYDEKHRANVLAGKYLCEGCNIKRLAASPLAPASDGAELRVLRTLAAEVEQLVTEDGSGLSDRWTRALTKLVNEWDDAREEA